MMRRALGASADHHLLVDTRTAGHLLSAPQGLGHFVAAAKTASAEVIVLDPLYSAHGLFRGPKAGYKKLRKAPLRKAIRAPGSAPRALSAPLSC